MPRKPRMKAESGIYHVMLRGINHQQVFLDEEDNHRFIMTLKKYKPVCGYWIFAYCLMGNHVHLLIKEGKENLETVFKRIGASYVYWYNVKYQRTGHLFQDRFKSEMVEDDSYLYTVINYIHHNPIKAGICRNPEDYPFSSYKEYTGNQDIVDLDIVENYIPLDTVSGETKIETEYQCLDLPEKIIKRVTDEIAQIIIRDISGCTSMSDFQRYDLSQQKLWFQQIQSNGVSIRQISRLTGVSYSLVQRSLNR